MKLYNIVMIITQPFLIFVIGFSVLLVVCFVLINPPWNGVEGPNLDYRLQGGDDDLLPTGFDHESCLSRRYDHHHSLGRYHHRGEPKKASPYLVSKLRSYEARHKRCGPHTEPYNERVEDLTRGRYSWSANHCNYIVWIPNGGLGNRVLSLASTFLYALLTDRVLLVDTRIDEDDLFCEPFPETSWLLPRNFPLTSTFTLFDRSSNRSYGNIVKQSIINSSSSLPSQQTHVFLYLNHNYDVDDKLFFCDQDQAYLHKVPWLVIKSNLYFTPSLFLLPSFEQELHRLFPEKDTVFHLIGRYLLHPTNSVWGLITRYYQAYLSIPDQTVGIQARFFTSQSKELIMNRIISCTMSAHILPGIGLFNSTNKKKKKETRVGVVITSLSSYFLEKLRDLYWENATETGDVIAVFQPSNEEKQQTDKRDHNRKAWAEMYLLSLTDKLVTSGRSTFGYVAQGLGGVKPWIVTESSCQRAMSMEPCFHAPPNYDCGARTRVDSGALVPHVRQCEDVSSGIKLFSGADPEIDNGID